MEPRSERGLVRWVVRVGPPEQEREHLVYQEHVDVVLEPAVEGDNSMMVVLMLGWDKPGFWNPGTYLVEFWDGADRVVSKWQFQVG